MTQTGYGRGGVPGFDIAVGEMQCKMSEVDEVWVVLSGMKNALVKWMDARLGVAWLQE